MSRFLIFLLLSAAFVRSASAQSSTAFYQQGIEAMRSRQYERAIQNFQKTIELEPNVIVDKVVLSGSGYLSQNELHILFGVGNRTIVDKMEIRWPCGKKEQLEGVGVNQLIVITEGVRREAQFRP